MEHRADGQAVRQHGGLPNLAGPRVLEGRIVPTLVDAARAAGRPAPRVVAFVAAVVTDDPDTVRATAAARMAFYDTVPSYAGVVAGLRRYAEAGATEIVLTNTDLGGTRARERTWRLAGDLARP